MILQVFGEFSQLDLAISVRVGRTAQTGRNEISKHRTAQFGSSKSTLVMPRRIDHVQPWKLGLRQRL